jgi:pimeloyl-ACP methyl ester carboxylesterase
VHGFTCAQDDWSPQVSELSADFRCVTLDLPGHGASALPAEVTLAALADGVNDVKRQLGDRQVILVGHSMGAKIVREAYSRSPEAVAGVVLIEGSLYQGLREDLVAQAAQRVDQVGFAAFGRGLFADMFLDTADPEVKERMITRAGELDPAFGRSLFLETVGWDPLRGKATLEQIAVPLLLLQATRFDADFVRRPIETGGTTAFIELVKELVPHAETRLIPASGHFPMLDAPETINRHIRDFGRRLARP